MEFGSTSRSPLAEVNPNAVVKSPATSTSKDRMASDDGSSKQKAFKDLIAAAKQLTGEGKIRHALKSYKQAYAIHASEKLQTRITKIEKYLSEVGDDSDEEDEEDGDDMVHLGNGFYLYKELYDKLYTHQREGVFWMWNLFRKKKGGILGDDMGLGKTIQVIAFLSGLFDADKVHAVLIVLPVAVIVNWEREFEKWAPGIRVLSFHGGTKRERERSLQKIHRRGGVALTSYGMLVHNAPQLAEKDGREFVWDYVILDEGHKIKNPSNKCSKGVHRIPARNRVILTGTPIMNNLVEMWALFDYCHQGALLGNLRTFKMEFESPINRASEKDATPGEQRLGHQIASTLTRLISPYFLRRSKAQLSSKQQKEGAGDNKDVPDMPALTRKNDLIIWVYLSEVQQRIYEEFSQSDEVKELLNSSKSPLVALTILKKICDHPRLLSARQCKKLGLFVDGDDNDDDDEVESEADKQSAALRLTHVPDALLEEESGKLVFLLALLDNLKAAGHRSLVFSQSRKMLDIIERILKNKGYRVARLDGQVRHLQEREDIITKFNRNKEYSVFLLTTGVGGVGLTLTAADRVVIFDPSWNPATDAQAVDRAFRIGQRKNVVIYRLITCGSVEEKIYRRQIFKDSLMRLTTGDTKNPYKYFSRQELRELFLLDNPRVSTTQQQLQELHAAQRKSDTTLDEHIAFLHSLDMYGVSDHDLMFSKEADMAEDHEAGDHDNDYIENRVTKAAQLLTLESEENQAMVQQKGGNLTSQVFRDQQAEALAASMPKQREEDLEKGMQHIHITEEQQAYKNRAHVIPDSDEEEEGNSTQSTAHDASHSQEEDEFVEASEHTPPAQNSGTITIDDDEEEDEEAVVGSVMKKDARRIIDDDGEDEDEEAVIGSVMKKDARRITDDDDEENDDEVGGGDTVAQKRDDRHRMDDDDDDVGGANAKISEDEGHISDDMDEQERQMLLQVMKLSKETAETEEKIRAHSWENDEEEDPEKTQIEKYCATPQGKCMLEDKSDRPGPSARTPTPRTPSRTPSASARTPSRTPKTPSRTPGVAEKTPSRTPKTPSRTPSTAKTPNLKPRNTPGTPNFAAETPTRTPRFTLETPTRTPNVELRNTPRTPIACLETPARSIKKNKRRSVCLGGMGDFVGLGAPRDTSPEVVQEQLTISPAVRTPLSRVQEAQDDDEDSPMLNAKRARRAVIASDSEEEEEEVPEDKEDEEGEDAEMSDDESRPDLGEVTSKSVRTFIMDDDDDEEDEDDEEEEDKENKKVFVADSEEEEEEQESEAMDHEEGEGVEQKQEEEDEEEEDEEDLEETEGEEEEESSEEESEEELTEEEVEQYNALMSKSKAYKGNGEFREALKYALQALKIYSVDEKAHLYVHKLKRKLQEQQQQ